MRVAHVVSTFPPYRGGQGNVAREIAERTAARGHDVVVVTPIQMQNEECRMKNAVDRIHHSSFTIHHYRPWLRFGNAAWSPTIARTLEAERVSVVHLHWPFIGGIAPVLAWRTHDPSPGNLSQFRAKLRKEGSTRRLVVQYHMDLIGNGWRGALFSAYQRRALPRVLAIADRIVVSSLDYARHGALAPFVEQLGERLVEIPLGVDVERFRPHESPLPPSPPSPQSGEWGEMKKNFSPSRRSAFDGSAVGGEGERLSAEALAKAGERVGISRLTTHDSRLGVFFVGALDRAHAFKGVDVLLAAVARLARTDGHRSGTDGHGFHGWRLRIVGDGDLRPAYGARARALGISDRVEFLGSVSDADLPGIYRNADVLVLPSTSRSEAFGVVLLEAMASSLPVIASDLPGVRTVVADGETGFLVPPGDVEVLAERLAMLAQDPNRARTMGAAARRRMEEQYGWDRIMDAWDACYASV